MKPRILLFVFLPLLFAADVYKSTTGDGTVEYSDRPSGQPDSLQLAPLTTITPPPSEKPKQPAAVVPNVNPVASPAIVVQSPGKDEEVRSNNGELLIILRVTPAEFGRQQHIELLLDGQRLPAHYLQTEIRLQGIDRGSHRLQALLVKNGGTVIARSEVTGFYLLRHSVLFSH